MPKIIVAVFHLMLSTGTQPESPGTRSSSRLLDGEPSPGSVVLLLNLNHTDAAPGVYLKYPSGAFYGSNDESVEAG